MPQTIGKRTILSGFTGAVFIAAGLSVNFEGEKLRQYFDPPHVATICFGHATGVYVGQVATHEQCMGYLKGDLAIAEKAVLRLVKVPLTDERRAALIDFVFNTGEGTLAKSTLLKKLNAGDTVGACQELKRFVYSGGQKLPGLVKRREAEYQLCVEGLE